MPGWGLPKVRIVLTKYHEEATVIRKSVKQVSVEACRRSTGKADSSVIELNPESTAGNKASPMNALCRLKIQQNEAIPILSAHAREVTDNVNLHAPSKNVNVRHPIDVFTGGLRDASLGDHHGDQKALRASNLYPSEIPHEHTGDEPCRVDERISSRYDLLVRRYIAMQEVTKLESQAGKGLIIEIKV